MKKYLKTQLEIAGRTLTLEVNKLAPQADASVLARYGDTQVLATVVSGKKTSLDYFPLTVDFVERLYAGGIIKGSRWVKREGRPTDEAVLTGRLIDRSLRPLFPKDFMDEVQITVTLLSTDVENDYDTLSIIAASTALAVSPIPWNGPIGAVRLGIIGEEIVVNPLLAEMEKSSLDLVVSANDKGVIMIEAGASQVPEKKMLEAIARGWEEGRKIAAAISQLAEENGQEKYPYEPHTLDKELLTQIERDHLKDIEPLIYSDNPSSKPKTDKIEELKKILTEEYVSHPSKNQVGEIVDSIIKKRVRQLILETKKRPDGRALEEIRPISGEVGLLPRTHGSAVFQRGLTQILSIVTLASPALEQWIETAEGLEEKQYLHHYNAPPYSLGETGKIGSPGRREIGHSALAERALQPVIPPQEQFPYTIRVVSEILSENGSSSMGSASSSTMALMDAGVPITAPVAGIAMGLVAESPENYVILADIAAFEDFYGNMDFKVAGTVNGITAIQLDIKLGERFPGLTLPMIEETLQKAKKGREFILEKMLEIIPETRKTISQYAPKVITLKVPAEKIGDVIGPGGKNIRNIIAATGAGIDIDDEGAVTISAVNPNAVEKAKMWIEGITREIQVGEEFDGEVKRVLPFGAFVEIFPGKEGLVHVSRMASGFVNHAEDVVAVGQKVKVKVTGVDDMGRLNLSMHWGGKTHKATTAREPRLSYSPGYSSAKHKSRR